MPVPYPATVTATLEFRVAHHPAHLRDAFDAHIGLECDEEDEIVEDTVGPYHVRLPGTVVKEKPDGSRLWAENGKSWWLGPETASGEIPVAPAPHPLVAHLASGRAEELYQREAWYDATSGCTCGREVFLSAATLRCQIERAQN